MEHAERRQLAVPLLALEGSGHRRDVPEIPILTKEAPELQVGVDPGLHSAEEL